MPSLDQNTCLKRLFLFLIGAVCADEQTCLQRPEDAIGSPGAGVPGTVSSLKLVWRTKRQSSAKAV